MYFDGGTATAYDLPTALYLKKTSGATAAMKTENWGYFEVAYKATQNDATSYWPLVTNKGTTWKDYDCFLGIVITAGVTGVSWIVLCIIQIYNVVKTGETYGIKVY